MLALKNRLMGTIGARDVATDRALLRSVSAINIFYPNPSGFGFIGKELLKLIEIPFVQLLALFLAKPGILSDRFQVFKHNHGSRLQRFYYLLADLMVNIGPETVLLLGKFAKVSFGRFTAAGLKLASEFFVTAGNMLNMPTAEKLIVGGNGKIVNTPVNADNFSRERNIGNFFLKNDMQENAVSSQKQISRRTFPIKVLHKIFGHSYWELLPAINSQKRNFVSVKPNVVTSCIVPDGAKPALWTRYFLFLLKPVPGSLKRFGGFRSGRNGKLRREVSSCGLIRLMVQRNAVKVFVLPSCLADIVKSIGVCF